MGKDLGDNYVGWARYVNSVEVENEVEIVICDSDEPGAFKIFRQSSLDEAYIERDRAKKSALGIYKIYTDMIASILKCPNSIKSMKVLKMKCRQQEPWCACCNKTFSTMELLMKHLNA